MHINRLLRVVAIFALSMGSFASSAALQNTETSPTGFVIVYYFHGNFRCVNCYNIEKYTKETVEQYFQKEVGSGKVVFKVINVETKGNEHFMGGYQLYTKSVVLSLVKNGKEVKFDNLTKVWEYLNNKDTFCQYLKNEIERYLKEL